MAIICPTITAYDNHEYRRQIEAVQGFAKRIHIDLMDGQFAPHVSPDLAHVWWPDGITADIHLMYQNPMNYIEQLIKLKPNLVVIPLESDADHLAFASQLKASGIKAGLSLQPETDVEAAEAVLPGYQHILIFSGNLGEHGGVADMSLLNKAQKIHRLNTEIEISWDGGINDSNAKPLIEGGIGVLNVGGFIQNSDEPKAAYDRLFSSFEEKYDNFRTTL